MYYFFLCCTNTEQHFGLWKSIPLAYFGPFWSVSKKVAGRSIYTMAKGTPNSRDIFIDIKIVSHNNIGHGVALHTFLKQNSTKFWTPFFSINVEGLQNHVFWLYNIVTFFYKYKMLGNNFLMIFLNFLQMFFCWKNQKQQIQKFYLFLPKFSNLLFLIFSKKKKCKNFRNIIIKLLLNILHL